MSRKQKQYHYIYKTVNQVNGKYYIGMHSTNDLDDGYIGSGQRLWHAINYHGRENFKKEILEFFPDRSSLKVREKEIVNSDLLKDFMCMNLKEGGDGGFVNEEHRRKAQSLGGSANCRKLNKKHFEKLEFDPEYRQKITESISKRNSGEGNPFYGKSHSKEAIEKMRNRKSQNGEKNSQFGTKWITNSELKQNKKIKKTEDIPKGWKSGRKKY